jgi:hypothetical protein
MQPRLTNPRSSSPWYSWRTSTRRKFWRHAQSRSTFQRRLYRRRGRPSWVLGACRCARCGALSAIPWAANVASRGSLSSALSPISRSGRPSTNHAARVGATWVTACGAALAAWLATARPTRSAVAMTFAPGPRVVFPVQRPLWGHHNGAVDAACGQSTRATLVGIGSQGPEGRGAHTRAYPEVEAPMTGLIGQLARRQRLPGGARAPEPEPPVHPARGSGPGRPRSSRRRGGTGRSGVRRSHSSSGRAIVDTLHRHVVEDI